MLCLKGDPVHINQVWYFLPSNEQKSNSTTTHKPFLLDRPQSLFQFVPQLKLARLAFTENRSETFSKNQSGLIFSNSFYIAVILLSYI